MKPTHRIAIALAATVILVSLGGAGTVAAHGNDKPTHPACQGDKYKISSEGADVGGETAGSKWFVKPVCTDEQGDSPHHHPHEPDDLISVPESETQGCHDTGRERSQNFKDDDC